MGDSRRKPQAPRQARKRSPKNGVRRRKVVVVCPECRARFHADLREESYKAECLLCSRPVAVAGAAESSRRREKAQTKNEDKTSDRTNVFHAARNAPQRLVFQQPSLPFLSAISFPWYPEVLIRWMFLSAGCSAVVFLWVAVNWCWSTGGVMSRAGYALSFPFGWLSIWTFSYLAASSTNIISETAAGADRVAEWPEPDWRQWFWEMFAYVPSLASAATVAYFVGRLTLLLAGFFWPALVGCMFLLTPIFVLSVFESGSPFMIISPFISASLFRRWWAWLRFYLTSGSLAVLWPGTLLLGYSLQPFYAAVVTGPLMAAVLLIYARLLGRLALVTAN